MKNKHILQFIEVHKNLKKKNYFNLNNYNLYIFKNLYKKKV